MISEGPTRLLHRRGLWWLALAAGVILRAAGLGRQVLVGDEMHAFRRALSTSFPEVLTTYYPSANSPPFNAVLRLFIELGVPPSELTLRIPILLSGVAALVLVPWWASRHLGPATAVVATWLLALWPQLVLYSRFMRPYMSSVLFACAAAGAFYDWWCTGRRSSAVTYVACAAATIYLHLPSGPFVLAPFLFLAGEYVRSGRKPRRPLGATIVLGALVAAPLLLLVLCAWPSLSAIPTGRGKPSELDADDLRGVLLSFAGTGVPGLALVLWAAVVVGVVRLARRAAALVGYIACLLITQIAAVLFLAPALVESVEVFVRYLLVIAVPLILLAAHGLSIPRRVLRVALPLVLAAWFVTNPLADLQRLTNPLDVRPDVFALPARETPAYTPPASYAILATGPRGAIVEAPVLPTKRFLRPLADAWRLHRRPVRICGDDVLADPRLGLRTIVSGHPQQLLSGDAAFLVVHRDWERELGPDLRLPGSPMPRGLFLEQRQLDQVREDAARWIPALERAFGPPDASDDDVAIWNLARIRAQRTKGAGEGR